MTVIDPVPYGPVCSRLMNPHFRPMWHMISQTAWTGYAVSLAFVAMVSLSIGLIVDSAHITNISMLYLLAVFLAAMTFGSGPAILAAITSFLTFNWFFVEPLHQFTISNPNEWVALLFFLLTALITGQLTAAVRWRALVAVQREREAWVLADVVRLLADGDLDHTLSAVAERLRYELELATVVIDLAGGSRVTVPAAVADESLAQIPRHLFVSGPPPTGEQRGHLGYWVRVSPSRLPGHDSVTRTEHIHLVPIKVGDRRAGTLKLERRPGTPPFQPAQTRLLSVVASQLGLATERERLRREVTEAEILRRTDELKTALVNAVSHNLRTPLASIIASAGSLCQQDVDWTDAERHEFAVGIEEEAQRLNRIVGNLLDLSRIESGNLQPEKGWYDLGALIDDVLGRLRPLTARHRLSVTMAADVPPVSLDYVQIDQVLSNLIENAVRYTPDDTVVDIRACPGTHDVRVEVADSGPGIPLSALPRLFDRFYRVEGGASRSTGTGVGLTVAKGLVEAHGGRMWAENRSHGGACFIFTLPLMPSRNGVDTLAS